jgi:hypothetical protein
MGQCWCTGAAVLGLLRWAHTLTNSVQVVGVAVTNSVQVVGVAVTQVDGFHFRQRALIQDHLAATKQV